MKPAIFKVERHADVCDCHIKLLPWVVYDRRAQVVIDHVQTRAAATKIAQLARKAAAMGFTLTRSQRFVIPSLRHCGHPADESECVVACDPVTEEDVDDLEGGLNSSERAWAKAGHVADATRAVRARTGCGLRDARALVDAWSREHSAKLS